MVFSNKAEDRLEVEIYISSKAPMIIEITSTFKDHTPLYHV